MPKQWFVIVNPTSGNGTSKKKWPLILNELKNQSFSFEFVITEHKNHAFELVEKAVNKGYKKIISVGGDGTLHSIVNGVLNVDKNLIDKIKIGIIPIGTGNDWVKTYGISNNFKQAIATIKKEQFVTQDIGKITLQNSNKTVYFNNLAGIGFDGFVVNKVHKFKNLGAFAYLAGALVSLFSYKKPILEFSFNEKVIKSKTLLLLFGICNYCGGGMQLTKNPNSTDGLFDISFVENITLFQLLSNITGLFNGKITSNKIVKNYKTNSIKIKILSNQESFIQADGELIGSGDFNVELLPKALNFITP